MTTVTLIDACMNIEIGPMDDMVAVANQRRESMREMSEKTAMAYVKEIIANNDIVFGIWPDPEEPDGVGGVVVIKGEKLLQDCLDGKPSGPGFRSSAVPCTDVIQAIAANNLLGDGTSPDALLAML